MSVHFLSNGCPQPWGCWGGPELHLSQQLWCQQIVAGLLVAWECPKGAGTDGKCHPAGETGAALCLGQASCAGLGTGAGPAGHRHCVLGISQTRDQESYSFTDLHFLSHGWPQTWGCWGGPEPPLSQQLWCLARGCSCGGHAQSPAAACGGHCPGASPAWAVGLGCAGLGCAGLWWAGERASKWGEVGRGWAGLGSAWYRATAASGSSGSI